MEFYVYGIRVGLWICVYVFFVYMDLFVEYLFCDSYLFSIYKFLFCVRCMGLGSGDIRVNKRSFFEGVCDLSRIVWEEEV